MVLLGGLMDSFMKVSGNIKMTTNKTNDMNKITEEEFNDKYLILSDGPKNINSGQVNVMFDKYEMLLKELKTEFVISTGIFASSVEAGEALVYTQYCKY